MYTAFDIIMIPLRLLIIFFTLYYFFVSWFGLFGKKKEVKIYNESKTFALIACAHNEEKVIEHFLGIVHVSNTSALTSKMTLESLFAKYGLSLSRMHGQSYDGASNMQGEYNGLKSLILKKNCSAFFIHCFAHQLQLAL